MKHCLIIPCSDAKLSYAAPAIDLYQGSLMEIVRAADLQRVLSHFDVLFLSAKHGLITANEVLSPYDTLMPSKESDLVSFSDIHAQSANALLRKYAHSDKKLFCVLSKNYQRAFDLMALKCLSTFSMVYQSKNARGIGDHRSRLAKILNSINVDTPPTLFRSGVSNTAEMLGFIQSGQAIGTSLAYLGHKALKQYVIDCVKQKRECFVDNGLITAVSRNETLDHNSVFKQYIELASHIRGPKSLSIVVPDSPTCQNEALDVIRTHKSQIRTLAKKCQVIIVFHKPVQRSVVEQARLVMKILGNVNVTLGIPCRTIKHHDWRLSVQDIESLFMLTGIDKTPMFKKVHFLALSEKTRGKTYQERLSLANMYNVEFAADACRVTALFGSEASSNRAGSVATREVSAQITKKNIFNDPDFLAYDSESEIDSSELWDQITYFSPQEKVTLWNECFPYVKIEEDNDDDLLEVFDNMTSAYFHDFIPKAKYFLYSIFKQAKHAPKHAQKRTEAIIKCFSNGSRQAVQQVMNI